MSSLKDSVEPSEITEFNPVSFTSPTKLTTSPLTETFTVKVQNSKLARNNVIPSIDTTLKVTKPPKERKITSLIANPSSYYEIGKWNALDIDSNYDSIVIPLPRRSLSLPYTKPKSIDKDKESSRSTPTGELSRSQSIENKSIFCQDCLSIPNDFHLTSPQSIDYLSPNVSPPLKNSLLDVSTKKLHHNRAHSYTPETSCELTPFDIPQRPISTNLSLRRRSKDHDSLSSNCCDISNSITSDDLQEFLYDYARGKFNPSSIPKKPRRLSTIKAKDGNWKFSLPASPLSEKTTNSDDFSDYYSRNSESREKSISSITSVTEENEDLLSFSDNNDNNYNNNNNNNNNYNNDINDNNDHNNYNYDGDDSEPYDDTDSYFAPPMPPNETERRRALWRFQILNTSQDVNFTRIVRLVKEHFNVPITLISLVNTTHQWFKAENGFGCKETKREVSFCGHAILQKDGDPFVVPDALLDWRFKKNPQVIGPPNIRFYAGAPLRTKDGHNVGTLCLIDTKPREFCERMRESLKDFAKVVMRELELWADRLKLGVRNKMQASLAEFSKFCFETQIAHDKNHSENGDPIMRRCFEKAVELIKDTLDVDALYLLEMPSLSARKIRYASRLSNDFSNDFLLNSPPPELPTKNLKFLAAAGLSISTDSISTPVTTSFLTHLIQTHPRGYIFQNALPQLPTLFPNDMCSGIVVPIYDNAKNAFGFIMALTKSPLRQFEDEERVYLGNFGVNIVSEVLKRRVIVADRAKGAFISSVSHELRTPLHGILASCELMSEGHLNEAQTELLKTIQSCGTGLISIINNVLNYAKMDNNSRDYDLMHPQPVPVLNSNSGNYYDTQEQHNEEFHHRHHQHHHRHHRDRAKQKEKVDLVKILEDVAESCVVGQQMVSVIYAKNNNSNNDENSSPSQARRRHVCRLLNPYQSKRETSSPEVDLLIDIEPREDGWWVMAEDGAIRQMLINIVGNALKFTQQGYIHISLATVSCQRETCKQSCCQHLPPDPIDEPERLHVLFTITDTGRGINQDFLTTHLFHPFTQEDPLQIGTGLGLSIVKLLVEKMGGKLDVESEVNVGTRVRIWLDFEKANESDTDSEDDTSVIEKKELKRKEKEIILREIQNKSVMVKGAKGKLKDVIQRSLKNWFNVKNVILEERPSKKDGDLVMILNEDLEILKTLLSESGKFCKNKSSWFNSNLILEDPDNLNAPIIFVTSLEKHGKFREIIEHIQEEIEMNLKTKHRKVVIISKPISPRKIENAILSCFNLKLDVKILPPQIITTPPNDDDTSSDDTLVSLQTPTNTPPTRNNPFENAHIDSQSLLHQRTPLIHADTMPEVSLSTLSSSPPSLDKFTPTPKSRTLSASRSLPAISNPELDLSSRSGFRSPRVLIIEDNVVNRKILSTFLKSRGIDFEEAENGAIGVQKYRDALEQKSSSGERDKKFDVVLMDIQMPVMNGNVATSEIRKLEREYSQRLQKLKQRSLTETLKDLSRIPTGLFPNLTNSTTNSTTNSSTINIEQTDSSLQNRSLIFALTGLAREEDKDMAFGSGVDGFLTKPVSLKTLDKVLKRWSEKGEFIEEFPEIKSPPLLINDDDNNNIKDNQDI
ncbi:two-component system sensor protein [Gigaspora margarita]|nr:two-component system sensor protein [Gigaspora margarita]